MSEKMMDASFVNAKAIRLLTKLLNESGLTEIEYQEGSTRIRVVKSVQQTILSPTPLEPTAAVLVPSSPAPFPEEKEISLGVPITSPMVGTVYLSSEPGASPYVQVGDSVQEGQTLLIIEAMKVMNPIRAPHSGKIAMICIKDSAPVEFGENLLYIN